MYSIKLKQRYLGRNHLIKQLRANQLLDEDTNCDVMNQCLQEIIPLFGIKSILSLIISNAKEHKLESICDIISRQKRKYKEERSSQNESRNNEESIVIPTKSLFSSLSKVSMSHIIDYLDKWSIQRIKIISRQFGIICLEQMNKITIGIFNMNYLLQYQKPLKLDAIYHNKINCNRYNSNVRYNLLYEQWAHKYNIPEQYQLIFNNIGCPTNRGIASAQIFNKQTFAEKKLKKDNFLLFDKRNVICFDRNNPKKFTQVDKNKSFSKILILEYFDIMNQTVQTLQFILYNGYVDLSEMKTYIKSNFISIGTNNLAHELQKHLAIMNNSVSKLIFYKHGPMGGLSKCSESGYVNAMRLTFELSNKQMIIKQKVNECQTEYNKNMIIFARDTKEFYKNNNEKTVYAYAKKNVSLLTKSGRFNIKINSRFFPLVLQNKIAKLLDSKGLVDPKSVALLQTAFKVNGQSYLTVNDSTKPMYHDNYCEFELLTFDAQLYDYSVAVNIFKPSECPHPVYNKYKKGISLRVLMIDNRNCTVQEFIDCVFDTISDMKRNHILYKYYKEILDISQHLDTSKCVLTNSVPKNKILANMEPFYVYLFTIKHQLVTKCNEFDLFLNGTVLINENAPISLKVKFWYPNDGIFKCVGMNLYVNINKSDSLQEIISNSVNNIDKFGYIGSCVRANNDNGWRDIEVIPPSEFNKYKPYYKFIHNNPTDFIIFKIIPDMQHKNNRNLCLPLNLMQL